MGGGVNPPSAGTKPRITGATVPAPAKPTRARRRPAVIALGLALVALGVLASVYLTTTLGQTHQVLAVTNDVARGETITSGDLTAVDLPTGPTLLKPVDAELIREIGGKKVAAADLPAGSLLTPGSFQDALQPAVGRSIVGIALAPNQMPRTALNAGDVVRIVETPVTGGDAPPEEPLSIPAVVVTSQAATIGDQTVVDVEVAKDKAAALAARAATGRVALVIDPALPTGEG
ncbi:hypothetical protein GCM10009751_21810 [Myceligenerans crystallogenes]|uniref:SAF domain-containing protein n=1 Tax=Myceligenerans crystallogenes TaxID=316335 RepID=A0ABP4ZM48_9MICO